MVTPLRPIGLTGKQVRELCMARMQAGARRTRITADQANLDAEEAALRAAFARNTHRTLTPSVPVTKQVRADMHWFYENRLRDSKAGRELWGEIISVGGRLCPFCHLAKPTTLEHSFPQSTYPRLAVEPLNLVPACRDCNGERLVGHGSITISPYFDAWAVTVPWLAAKVLDPAHPEDLEFTVVRDAILTRSQWNALQQFVRDVDLLDRYVGLAIDAFAEFTSGLKIAYPVVTESDARWELDAKVSSHLTSFGINRWQTVAFSAWRDAVDQIAW